METGETIGMLDLMIQGAFSVQNQIITRVNQAAKARMIEEGIDISEIIKNGLEEYRDFSGGCLYLTLTVAGHPCGASVTRIDGADIFVLEQDADRAELQAMALAARELRAPLSSVMSIADQLFPMTTSTDEPEAQNQIAQINRGLFQMLRVISNMSDAVRYTSEVLCKKETRDIGAMLDEIFQRAAPLIGAGGIQLHYTGLKESVFCSVDPEKIERAVYNILSNAMKFTPKGGTIDARLTRRNKKLYLTVQDSGCGIADSLRGSIHTRFLREPVLEDGRFGIGLGMVLIRAAASIHGGTVLIDQPSGQGTRITMTMEIQQTHQNTVRSSILRVDYAGERDHGLIELSDCLPASLYEKDNIN